jgi:hypothetical protein
MRNYTEIVGALPPPVQSILGGLMFGGIILVFSVIILGDMHQQIRRIERVLKEDDKYIN